MTSGGVGELKKFFILHEIQDWEQRPKPLLLENLSTDSDTSDRPQIPIKLQSMKFIQHFLQGLSSRQEKEKR